MAKMFYTLEEAAAKLGLGADAVKQMASEGKLQQFRDRDKLMFKRDQVDALASSGASGTGISLADSGDTDAIDLQSDSSGFGGPAKERREDPREATGVSVFDADEVTPADPMAQTQVTSPSIGDEDLALESVGSGSGLLDLTRESDDTSLGAELLDEIYPGGGEASDAKLESAAGSSGVFEGAISMETGASGPSGLENLGEPSPVEPSAAAPAGGGAPVTYAAAAEPYDPAGSGLATGMFLGTTATLVLGLMAVVASLAGARSQITTLMTSNDNSVFIWCGGLLVVSILLGVLGMFIGKALGGAK
jgi:excisionase family DNA binding protein